MERPIRFSELYCWKGETYQRGRVWALEAAEKAIGRVPNPKEGISVEQAIKMVEILPRFKEDSTAMAHLRTSGTWPWDRSDTYGGARRGTRKKKKREGKKDLDQILAKLDYLTKLVESHIEENHE